MSIQNYFIITPAQRGVVVGFNTQDVAVEPRAIDNGSPGVGLNLNPAANGVPAGAAVTLTGNYVAPKRIVDDPEYQTYAPGMIAFLLTLPFAALEDATIFAPGVRG